MKIYPLPVKKNKHGELVASLSITRQYRQIMEEVMEAHAENVGAFESNEAEELADVITSCITRLANIHSSVKNIGEFISGLVNAAKTYVDDSDFYTDLATSVMQAYSTQSCEELLDYYDVRYEDYDEDKSLAEVIALCEKRLESMGYDEVAREKIYAAVNEKNRRRGYLED